MTPKQHTPDVCGTPKGSESTHPPWVSMETTSRTHTAHDNTVAEMGMLYLRTFFSYYLFYS